MDLRGFLYLPRHVLKTSYPKLVADLRRVRRVCDKEWPELLWDMLICSVRYKASFEDYCDLRLWRLPPAERAQYACTGAVYEFRRSMNSRRHFEYFRSKALFHETFRKYTGRQYLYLRTASREQFGDWLKRFPVFIAKPNYGMLGRGITRVRSRDWPGTDELWRYLQSNRLDLLEEPIAQHPALDALNPSCVNTVRVITVLHRGKVDVIGTVLRIGVGGLVDNFASGGIAAPVDAASGRVLVTAVGNSFEDTPHAVHPITHTPIVGFAVPHWPEVISLACEAATVVPQVRTVGWDIAIGVQAPLLVEGNHDWCKAWQVPQGQGCLPVLQRYM